MYNATFPCGEGSSVPCHFQI